MSSENVVVGFQGLASRFEHNHSAVRIYLSILNKDYEKHKNKVYNVEALLKAGGEVDDRATYGELLRHDGTYERIVHKQFITKVPGYIGDRTNEPIQTSDFD